MVEARERRASERNPNGPRPARPARGASQPTPERDPRLRRSRRWSLDPQYLMDADDVSKLLRAARGWSESGDRWARRDAAFVVLALRAGLRASEFGRLRVLDFSRDASPPYVRVFGKGDRWRSVPLSDASAAIIARAAGTTWLRTGTLDGLPLLISRAGSGRSLTRHGAAKIWRRVCARAHLSRTYRLHDARHTCASRLYRATRDLVLVARMLGHSRVSTAQVYVDHAPSALSAAVAAMEQGEDGDDDTT